jgi:hypothetical protein
MRYITQTYERDLRTIARSMSECLPLHFGLISPDSNVPSYNDNKSRVDEIFHFDSLAISALPPKSLLALRVAVLIDATLLRLRVPHFFVDAYSLFGVVRAYAELILGGVIPKLVLPDHNVSTSQVMENVSNLIEFTPELSSTRRSASHGSEERHMKPEYGRRPNTDRRFCLELQLRSF